MNSTPSTATNGSSIVRTDHGDGVSVLTLNRPSRLNAFDLSMLNDLRAAVEQINYDSSVDVVIITGTGRAFCAGRDVYELKEERGLPRPQYRSYMRTNHQVFDEIEAMEKPVIAAVNGVCAGGGVELAASCDFRFSAADATFLLPEIRIGVIPGSGVASRMIPMIGVQNVKDLMMTGRTIDAAEAASMGFVRTVVEPAELMASAMSYAADLRKGAPDAIGTAKAVVRMCQNMDSHTGRYVERLAQSGLSAGADANRGLDAFLSKEDITFDRQRA